MNGKRKKKVYELDEDYDYSNPTKPERDEKQTSKKFIIFKFNYKNLIYFIYVNK